ncbi:dipeptide ABC transporter ATP-binding protein [Kordiimonas pumila]|uniref:Dipeptide ABC transporter ATP-binding protein n=1 Tax=Kordiimonas pumila TaxID=2161677 RepID=A0ABV7D887_9PROT|nr:ABC transporter ATP-binding protein [Kordiimonas pumila]
MTTHSENIVSVKGLSLGFMSGNTLTPVIQKASLDLVSGRTTALIGESGSGKTLLAKALVNLVPKSCKITEGEIWWHGENLLSENASISREQLRGKKIAFIFQEPLSSLNPALKIGIQLTEGLSEHSGIDKSAAHAAAIDMLNRVKINNPDVIMKAYPHELSGGMRQRVMIASALIMQPDVLIADEPTTALDMVIRDEILGLMTQLATEMGAAVLIISHDLGAVARLADTISVMQKGMIVETGTKDILLSAAKHPYTQKLLSAIPQPDESMEFDNKSVPKPLLSVENLEVSFKSKRILPFLNTVHMAVKDVSFTVAAGETLAIIGESGSGKTTVARTVAGLQAQTAGTVAFDGGYSSAFEYAKTSRLQYIFQDPAGALNPRIRIGKSIEESLLPLRMTAQERQTRIQEALEQVGMPADTILRFPHQLSGGQRQRVCIARAIAPKPDFIIADEPVSALDLTIQKQVLDLFLTLKQEMQFACLFISHDLGVVEHIADRVGVLLNGKLVEIGPSSQIFNAPKHPYTQQLLAATPYLKKSNKGYALARRYCMTET